MIDTHDYPIGFTMELAQHPEVLDKFGKLSHPEQERIVDGARAVSSRDEMRNYVEQMIKWE